MIFLNHKHTAKIVHLNLQNSQYTFSFQRSDHWVLIDASNSIQRYRVRERKWQTMETLVSGVYVGIKRLTLC